MPLKSLKSSNKMLKIIKNHHTSYIICHPQKKSGKMIYRSIFSGNGLSFHANYLEILTIWYQDPIVQSYITKMYKCVYKCKMFNPWWPIRYPYVGFLSFPLSLRPCLCNICVDLVTSFIFICTLFSILPCQEIKYHKTGSL